MNTLPQKLKILGKNFSGTTTPVTCQFEMVPTDVARSHLLVDSSYDGFGPYGDLYEVLSIITPCPFYSLGMCLDGQEITSGGVGVDGCPLPLVCKTTYSWMIGPWGACTNNTQARLVTCQDNFVGNTVSNFYCSGTQPAISQACNVAADPLCTIFPELCI